MNITDKTNDYLAIESDGSITVNSTNIDSTTNAIKTITYEHNEIHGGSHYYIEGSAVINNGATVYAKLMTPDTAKWSHFVWNISSNGILETNFYEIPTGGMSGGSRAVIHANNRNINCWSGRHDGGDDQATLSDSTQSWTDDELIDMQVFNQTDGSSAFITDNDATTATAVLSGGGADWDDGDLYEINNSQMVITSGTLAPTSLGLIISNQNAGGTGWKSDVGGGAQRIDEIITKRNTLYLRTFASGTDGNIVSFKASWYEHENE